MMNLSMPSLTDSTGSTASQGTRPKPARLAAAPQPKGKILFLKPDGDDYAEEVLPAAALKTMGYQLTVAIKIHPDISNKYDLVVVRRPHANRDTMESLAACTTAGIPAILDLELDYQHMPHDHPEYERNGLNTLARAKAYAAALQAAKAIRVTSETFGDALRLAGHQVQVIPEGWSRSNPLWNKPAAFRPTLNIGWVSSPGGWEDLLGVRRILLRVLREFTHARLIISGENQARQLLDTFPEESCLFLPTPNQEDLPYLLSQMDLLIVPMRPILFHRHGCDRRLMEAGVRGIPWIASPTPAVLQWNAGGLVANSLEEWHTFLRQLVVDPGVRHTLGQAGYRRALGREMNHMGAAWYELVSATLNGKDTLGLNWTVQ